MRKNLVLTVGLIILTVPVFSQNINKTQYTAVDPFDYKLYEYTNKLGNNITREVGKPRKFKSVVEFVSETQTKYNFSSLDKHTTLEIEPAPGLKPPSPGKVVTIYYTVNWRNKRFVDDDRILDLWEENNNKDEKGLGVQKSGILPPPSEFKANDYIEASLARYKEETQDIQDEDQEEKPRRYLLSDLILLSQDGVLFKFSTPDEPKVPVVSGKVTRRYDYEKFKVGQKVKIYFTAVKDAYDYRQLDDIVVMN